MKQKARGLALFSLIFIIGPFWWSTDVGDRTLAPAEAWQAGASQVTILSGMALLALSVFLYRSSKWAAWGVLLWCPVSILSAVAWSAATNSGSPSPSEFFVGTLPVMLLWVWGSWRYMIKESESRHAVHERG
jgi:hypothetical protein